MQYLFDPHTIAGVAFVIFIAIVVRMHRHDPVFTPSCWGSRPSPQEAAENDCHHCLHVHSCAARADVLDRERATSPGSLLRAPTDRAPAGCYCRGTCAAPVIMGRQQPCRRPGGIPGQPVPRP